MSQSSTLATMPQGLPFPHNTKYIGVLVYGQYNTVYVCMYGWYNIVHIEKIKSKKVQIQFTFNALLT